jgi:hypothetical protein
MEERREVMKEGKAEGQVVVTTVVKTVMGKGGIKASMGRPVGGLFPKSSRGFGQRDF